MHAISALLQEIGGPGFALALAVVFVGAMVQAAIGMGLNLFSVGLLALIHPVFAPGPVLVYSFLLSAAASVRLRRDVEPVVLGLSLAGVVVGTGLASLLLSYVGRGGLPTILGVITVAAAALTAAGLKVPITVASILGASTAAGLMGTIAGSHGAPVALLYQGESPARVRAALLPLFTIANPLALVALGWAGLFGWAEVWASVLLLPALAAGFFAAPLFARMLSARTIRFGLIACSGLSGVLLVLKG